jgi:Putative Flp pilus-assembly TadE/G-like
MNHPGRRRAESGQAMVLLALSIVALLGFAGLAIDGGILYTERRRAQNAADAAAMAGALGILNGWDPIWSAYSRAADNGYDNNLAENWVEVYRPPIEGPNAGDWNYVMVRIRARVTPVFIHLVYSGPLENTVTAVARAKPPTSAPLLSGQALVGLSPHGCSVVWSHGTSMSSIEGSGIFVNSDDPDCALVANGGNELFVTGGDIRVVGGWEVGNNSNVVPVPISGAQPVRPPEVKPPTCSQNAVKNNATNTVSPGNISSLDFTNGDWTLEPGIYCVTNGFRINGGSVTGEDVMFYVESGAVSWSGNATIRLDAPDDGEFAGMLLYQSPSNGSTMTVNGNSGSAFTGTIFVPGAEIQVNGTGGSDGFHSQLVGYKVDLSGTADLRVIYNPAEQYVLREPGKVDLTQ